MLATPTGRNVHNAALTVDVEDWFHSANFHGLIDRSDWDDQELRVERSTNRLLEILDICDVKATFFVLGWVASKRPSLVRAISDAGHEIASHGYHHELVYTLGGDEFRRDVSRSKSLLEDITGQRVRGYRAPCFSITDQAIDILQDLDFEYDSSVVQTSAHDRYGRIADMERLAPISSLAPGFHEVCVSCIRFGRVGIPWGGGGYFRFVPYRIWRMGVRAILNSGAPYIFYIHPWELDPAQPRLPGMTRSNSFRQTVNLARCAARFEQLVKEFEWTSIRDLVKRQEREAVAFRTSPSADIACERPL